MNRPLIAIVNDASAQAHLLDLLLTRAGYRTVTHRQRTGAYALLKQTRPALLTLNIKTEQRATGWRVLNDLRRDPTLRRLPVLIYSAAPQIAAQVAARSDPYCAVLPLVFDHDRLPAIIAQMIAR